MEPKDLGQRIRELREQRGISQEQFATNISRDQRAVSLYENGQRRIYAHEIPRIAAALGVPIAALYEDYGTETDLDAALLQEFHRLRLKSRKTVLEVIRLLSDDLSG